MGLAAQAAAQVVASQLGPLACLATPSSGGRISLLYGFRPASATGTIQQSSRLEGSEDGAKISFVPLAQNGEQASASATVSASAAAVSTKVCWWSDASAWDQVERRLTLLGKSAVSEAIALQWEEQATAEQLPRSSNRSGELGCSDLAEESEHRSEHCD